MDVSMTILGIVDALFFFGGILSLIVLPGWLQARHREMAKRQIALTDALDAEFGPLVAPVVRKPLWGPWRIEIATPLGDAAQIGRILAVTHEVLAIVHGMAPSAYWIVLRAKPNPLPGADGYARRSTKRWAGEPAAA